MRHFLSLSNITAAELEQLLGEAARLKADLKRGHRPPLLAPRDLRRGVGGGGNAQ